MEVTPRQSQRGAYADDVRDRVPASGLVEVHLVGRDPVDSRFGLGQPLEHAPGPLPHLHREIRMREQGLDVAPAAMRLILRRTLYVHFGSAHPGPPGQRGRQPDRFRHHDVHGALQNRERGAGVDERREQHIAGHTCRSIHPCVPACTGCCHDNNPRRTSLERPLLTRQQRP
jgi:hypothetical protein